MTLASIKYFWHHREGKRSTAELVERWNRAHPDDAVDEDTVEETYERVEQYMEDGIPGFRALYLASQVPHLKVV